MKITNYFSQCCQQYFSITVCEEMNRDKNANLAYWKHHLIGNVSQGAGNIGMADWLPEITTTVSFNAEKMFSVKVTR